MKKTILITGSTDGIGKLAAKQFANDGHEVIVHGRNREKLNKVVDEIINTSGNNNIHQFAADFSDLNQINNFVDEIIKSIPKIDVLINNAGIFNSPVSTTNTGHDIRFAVNYLAPVLLTNRLIPLLEKVNKPRIINLSSAAQSPVSIDALKGKQQLSVQAAYAQSKLALTMWSFYLAEQLKSISVIPVNPGSLLNTKMVQEAYGQYWSPANKGSELLCQIALEEKHFANSGKYFDNDKGMLSNAHPDAYDQEKINRLIYTTNEILSSYESA